MKFQVPEANFLCSNIEKITYSPISGVDWASSKISQGPIEFSGDRKLT